MRLRYNTEKLEQMIARGKGLLKLITLAPEMPGSADVIACAVRHGLTVSMGHTDATYAQAVAAIRGKTPEDMAEITVANTCRLFGITLN